MSTNLLKAIYNLTQKPLSEVKRHYSGINRANSIGEALECYIRDLFCATVDIGREKDKYKIYQENFSYLGNQNNPPDIIISDGDAIEVKKISHSRPSIALNSSYPKNKLYADSPMITEACRKCEGWKIKDVIYAIGAVEKDRLRELWMIYGDCYAADKEIYESARNKIITGLRRIDSIKLEKTKELGRMNKVDPLGITYLRVRSMWGIDNPSKVFGYLHEVTVPSDKLSANFIMKKAKYDTFPSIDRRRLEDLDDAKLGIHDVTIKSPDNPAQMMAAKLITFRC